ncbi:MAG: polyphosphate kinase 2 family protein [Armatimonadota bacterium]|jgi:PPK2 family polyphosphate:nucleotide phosphotransferase
MRAAEKLRIRPGTKVRLADHDPDDTAGVASHKQARAGLAENIGRLEKLQDLLWAESRRSLLVILQGIDAAGKDGTIRHVMSGVNPQGCRITSFKQPSVEELQHDFLWRIHAATPRQGEIGIFNRSQYESVLVERVHNLVPKSVWSQRYDHINAFERSLVGSGVMILKFFLHISEAEQRVRLRERLSDPTKAWKCSPADFEERKLWSEYMKAYEDALSRCSTEDAPWYVIPANRKWYRNLAVSEIIVDTLHAANMKYPPPTFDLSKIAL